MDSSDPAPGQHSQLATHMPNGLSVRLSSLNGHGQLRSCPRQMLAAADSHAQWSIGASQQPQQLWSAQILHQASTLICKSDMLSDISALAAGAVPNVQRQDTNCPVACGFLPSRKHFQKCEQPGLGAAEEACWISQSAVQMG